jgi:hypothetical protein
MVASGAAAAWGAHSFRAACAVLATGGAQLVLVVLVFCESGKAAYGVLKRKKTRAIRLQAKTNKQSSFVPLRPSSSNLRKMHIVAY